MTAPLIVDIEQSNILDERTLDQLAEGFLWDDHLAWLVPEQWIRDGTVRLPHKRRKPGRIAVVIDRPIPPQLRRWAAARVVAREPRTATDVLGRVNEMGSRSGDAAMAGLLDGASALPPEDRDALTELGCAWRSGTVRLRALKLLAETETDEQAALRRAAHDASETIRTWGQKRGSPQRAGLIDRRSVGQAQHTKGRSARPSRNHPSSNDAACRGCRSQIRVSCQCRPTPDVHNDIVGSVLSPFDPETGRLPEGVHEADLDEVVERFGWNPRRRQLLDGLADAIESPSKTRSCQ